MKLRLAFLFLMSGHVAAGFAQAPATEMKPLAPFVGKIGYRITYTGLTKEAAAIYPDSMTIWSQPPLLRATWHGGLADTMNLQLHWDAAQHQLWMIDLRTNTVQTLDELDNPGIKTTIKPIGKATIAGLSCTTSEWANGSVKTQYAFSDSLHFPYSLPDSLRDSLGWRLPPFMLHGKQGIPLSIKRTNPDVTTTTLAVNFERIAPPAEVFSIPSGSTPKAFDPLVRFHPLIPAPKKPE